MTYADVTAALRSAYALSADKRDEMVKHPWKIVERDAFLERLAAGSRLLEIGAGTGQDSAFFRDNGLEVIATDLTPEMVDHCRAKGLEAHVMDVLHLDFPDASFDAAWTMNALLHVPSASFAGAIAEIARVVRPDGLLYLGVHAGERPSEGILTDDQHDPKRFFCFRSDEDLTSAVRRSFEIVDFHALHLDAMRGRDGRWRFQSVTARRR